MSIILRIIDSPSKTPVPFDWRRRETLSSKGAKVTKNYSILSHAAFAVTGSVLRGAFAGLGQLAIRAEARLSINAPKAAVVGGRYRRIMRNTDKHSFPSQGLA
jgi:hypothetical protein